MSSASLAQNLSLDNRGDNRVADDGCNPPQHLLSSPLQSLARSYLDMYPVLEVAEKENKLTSPPSPCSARGAQSEDCKWARIDNPSHPHDPIYINKVDKTIVPLGVEKKDVALAGIALTATAVSLAREHELLEAIQKTTRGKKTEKLARVGKQFGSSVPPALFLSEYLIGLATHDDETKNSVSTGVKALLVTGAFNDLLKIGVHRALPSDTQNPFARGKSDHPSSLAFPSSHTASAASAATWIAETYKDRNELIPYLAYGAMFLTTWERPRDNQHWVGDLPLAIAEGHFITKAMMSKRKANRNVVITPYIGRDKAGLMASYVGKVKNTRKLCGDGLEGAMKTKACFEEALGKSG